MIPISILASLLEISLKSLQFYQCLHNELYSLFVALVDIDSSDQSLISISEDL